MNLFFAIPVNMFNGFCGLIIFDIIGFLFLYKHTGLAHCGHLGGALFGTIYVLYGSDLWRNRRKLLNQMGL